MRACIPAFIDLALSHKPSKRVIIPSLFSPVGEGVFLDSAVDRAMRFMIEIKTENMVPRRIVRRHPLGTRAVPFRLGSEVRKANESGICFLSGSMFAGWLCRRPGWPCCVLSMDLWKVLTILYLPTKMRNHRPRGH
jgi:hypothetical protein